MNFNGDGPSNWCDTGYISLFEYNPEDVYSNIMGKRIQPACQAIIDLSGKDVVFFFIPKSVKQINLNGDNVRHPQHVTEPTLYNTDHVNVPLGPVDAYGNAYHTRYINEYLHAGGWAEGTYVFCESFYPPSPGFEKMKSYLSIQDIINYLTKKKDRKKDQNI